MIYKYLGPRASVVVGGLIGGVISSTATTVSYARRVASAPAQIMPAVVVIMLACTVMYVRLLIEVAVVAPWSVWDVAPPILAMGGWTLLWALVALFQARRKSVPLPEQENPTELKSALFFGIMYALVLLAVAWGTRRYGDQGTYAVAFLSGLTNMDAITLSSSTLLRDGRTEPETVWRIILIAAMSNILFKAAAAAIVGGRAIFYRLAIYFALCFAGGGAILAFWPRSMP
jgi:uncharacterized membrane protein (DUF4010 family)